jgi:Carboxypeptidase regulatory-like domain
MMIRASGDWPERGRRFCLALLALLALPVLLVVPALAQTATTKLTIHVVNDSDRPVDRASVIVKFVQGRDYIKFGKKIRDTYELRTNQEGEASIPEIPQGKILVQIIAKGYQTYGQTLDINESERTVEIKLNPPQKQYSAHEKE